MLLYPKALNQVPQTGLHICWYQSSIGHQVVKDFFVPKNICIACVSIRTMLGRGMKYTVFSFGRCIETSLYQGASAENHYKSKCCFPNWRYWLFLRLLLPLNLTFPRLSLYRVVVWMHPCFSPLDSGPRSNMEIRLLLLQTQVLLKDKDPYFRIQKAVL